MKMLSAFMEWAACCWASFQQYFALAMQLADAQAGWAAGGVPNVPPSNNSATSSTGYGRPLSTKTEKPTQACATEEAAGRLGRMHQNRQDESSPIKEPSSSTNFPEELAEMLRQCCEANGPVENHKVRQELAALYALASAHSS